MSDIPSPRQAIPTLLASIVLWTAGTGLSAHADEPASAPAAPPDAYLAAQKSAAINLWTTMGRAYDAALARHSTAHHGPWMTACIDGDRSGDRRTFVVLFEVAANGRVQQALVWPETRIGVCFRDTLTGLALPEPPRGGYWMRMEMKLAP